MSIFVSSNTQPMSNIQNQMQVAPKRPQPLKEQIDSLSQDSQDKFKDMVDSLSTQEKQKLGGMMMQNKKELSSLEDEELEEELFAMIEDVKSSNTNSTSSSTQAPAMPGMMPPPPPPPMLSQETATTISSALDDMEDEEKSSFDSLMKSLKGNERMQFGELLKEKENELLSMSSDEIQEQMFSLIDEAKKSSPANNSGTKAYFINTYA